MMNTLFVKRMMLASAAVLLAGITAVAQAPSGGGQPSTPNTQPMPSTGPSMAGADNSAPTAQRFSDQAFVKKALEGGDAEVQLGQLAQQKSQSPDVKQFGQKMVQDHTQQIGRAHV